MKYVAMRKTVLTREVLKWIWQITLIFSMEVGACLSYNKTDIHLFLMGHRVLQFLLEIRV